MKTQRTPLIALLAVFCLLCNLNLQAGDPPSPQPPEGLLKAADKADMAAAKAVMTGDVKSAQAWASVGMQIRMSAYMAPLSDLAVHFKSSCAHLPQFVKASMEVENCKPVVSRFTARFSQQMFMAFLEGDVSRFKAAKARGDLWQCLLLDEHDTSQKDLEELMDWLETGKTTPGVSARLSHPKTQKMVAALSPFLRPLELTDKQ